MLESKGIDLLFECIKADSNEILRILILDFNFDPNYVDAQLNQSVIFKIVMFNATKCLTQIIELYKANEIHIDCDILDYRGFCPLH